MARKSTLQLAVKDIRASIIEDYRYVFSSQDLNQILKKHALQWKLAESVTLRKFESFLKDEGIVRKITILNKNRFVKKQYSDYEIIQSIQPNLFFSHYTALRLHSLTEQIPNDVYVSSRRKRYDSDGGSFLSQDSIDDAFTKLARKKEPSGTYKNKNKNIYLLDNVASDVDVISHVLHDKEREIFIHVTNLEKTLIDATIRPYYCGGVLEVIKAYDNAKDIISINKILSILNRNMYRYPYAQNIGFYLDYVGYQGKHLNKIKEKISQYDFYLDRNIPNKSYSKEWKIYYPSYL